MQEPKAQIENNELQSRQYFEIYKDFPGYSRYLGIFYGIVTTSGLFFMRFGIRRIPGAGGLNRRFRIDYGSIR